MLFWIFGGLMTSLAALIVLLPILRTRLDTSGGPSSDLAVYRDQLKELDADVERGILSPSEAQESRSEISRRLLAADARETAAAKLAPKGRSQGATVLLAVTLIVGTLGLYSFIGAPGTPDQPLAERALRMSQDQAEQQFQENGAQPTRTLDEKEAELLARLRDALDERPDDLTGHRLLVQTLNSIGDLVGAHQAQKEVLRILGDQAMPQEFAQHAELMVFAAGGYVSPEADQALSRALRLDPSNQSARYYSGVSMAQNRKPELAMQLWAGLLSEGDQDAPWKEPVRAQMQALAASSGLAIPESLMPGPTQEDIEAASAMSKDERQDMIRGMVEGLSDRLATQGGTPAEWARLIRALAVLGDNEQAQAIHKEAQSTFSQNEAALSAINDAAKEIGTE